MFATAAIAEFPPHDLIGASDTAGPYIPPQSPALGCSGISLCAELTLVTIGCGQGACLEGSLLTSTQIT